MFNADSFHKFCDGRGPTITVIKSDYDKIFGGFTDINWHQSSGVQYGNNNTFVFYQKGDGSFKKLKSIEGCGEIIGQKQESKFAIFGQNGWKEAIIILKDADQRGDNNCHSMICFEADEPDLDPKSNKARSLLAGSNAFRVREIEVYTLM